jgi:nucleolar protein 9
VPCCAVLPPPPLGHPGNRSTYRRQALNPRYVRRLQAGKVLEGVSAEAFGGRARDPTGSHVLEVVMEIAPPALMEEIHTRFLAGSLASLARDPSANFVAQAALSAACSPAMAKSMYEELSPLIGELLARRRGGVVAALVGACGRHVACQREMCAAMEAALMATAPWAGNTAEAALAPALLCMDSQAQLGPLRKAGSAGGDGSTRPPRLSPLGSSILIGVLGFGQGACRSFTDSVAGLKGEDAIAVGADPSGSRVMEALIDGTAPAKVRSSTPLRLHTAAAQQHMQLFSPYLVYGCVQDQQIGLEL